MGGQLVTKCSCTDPVSKPVLPCRTQSLHTVHVHAETEHLAFHTRLKRVLVCVTLDNTIRVDRQCTGHE
jgi:hypothetical protein